MFKFLGFRELKYFLINNIIRVILYNIIRYCFSVNLSRILIFILIFLLVFIFFNMIVIRIVRKCLVNLVLVYFRLDLFKNKYIFNLILLLNYLIGSIGSVSNVLILS